MGKTKRSYRDDLIRFGSAFFAIALYLFGPRFVESDITRDIDEVVQYVKAEKVHPHLKNAILSQFSRDRKFAQQNAEKIEKFGVKLTFLNWLALGIFIVGFAGPFILKMYQNYRSKRNGSQDQAGG